MLQPNRRWRGQTPESTIKYTSAQKHCCTPKPPLTHLHTRTRMHASGRPSGPCQACMAHTAAHIGGLLKHHLTHRTLTFTSAPQRPSSTHRLALKTSLRTSHIASETPRPRIAYCTHRIIWCPCPTPHHPTHRIASHVTTQALGSRRKRRHRSRWHASRTSHIAHHISPHKPQGYSYLLGLFSSGAGGDGGV